MQQKHILTLAGVGVLSLGLGLYLTQEQKGDSEFVQAPLLPRLAQHANGLSSIKVETAGNTLVVEALKKDGQWSVTNLDGYQADTQALGNLIQSLKDAELVEPKTQKAAFYERLGLRDISDEKTQATAVTLSGDGYSQRLLLGNLTRSGSGQYARLAEQAQSWLLNTRIDVPLSASEWIDNTPLTLGYDEIKQVQVQGEQAFRLHRDEKAANFVLDQIPEGKKLQYESAANALARNLSQLSVEGVRGGSVLTKLLAPLKIVRACVQAGSILRHAPFAKIAGPAA